MPLTWMILSIILPLLIKIEELCFFEVVTAMLCTQVSLIVKNLCDTVTVSTEVCTRTQ